MESAETKVNYVIYTKVLKVEEKFDRRWISGVGPEAIFEDVSKGWFVQFVGSQESIQFPCKPDYAVGDQIKITFERMPPCQPLTNTNPTISPKCSSWETAEVERPVLSLP